jgi:hypothetical protein
MLNSHSGGGVQTVHAACRPLLAFCTCPGWLWGWRIWWNEDWQGKTKCSDKTCHSTNLSTTDPTWPDPGANPGRRGGKPATNRLSYGAAITATSLRYHWGAGSRLMWEADSVDASADTVLFRVWIRRGDAQVYIREIFSRAVIRV